MFKLEHSGIIDLYLLKKCITVKMTPHLYNYMFSSMYVPHNNTVLYAANWHTYDCNPDN